MQVSLNNIAQSLYTRAFNSTTKNSVKKEYENIAQNFAQNAYTITAPRVEKVLQEGKIESLYPSVSQTPFSSALSQKQCAVSESAYNEAIKRISELMNELSAFVAAQQGADSELAYFLDTMSVFFAGQAKFNDENLNAIKNQINNSKSDDKDIINSINAYFTLGASTAENAIRFFDYASDKIKGLPVARIMQDLSTIKGWWDNNSRENLSFDDGTKVSLKRVLDKNGNATQMLEIISAVVANNVKFNETKFQNENIKTLFEMFKQRENLSGLDSDLNSENLDLKSLSNSSENLHLNSHLNLANSSGKSNTNLNLNTLNLSENLDLNSHSNLTNLSVNLSENLGKNLNLQAKINFMNLNANSKQNLNLNALNLSENLSKTNSKDSFLKSLLKSV